jgi:D-alanine-D-alanine ligase
MRVLILFNEPVLSADHCDAASEHEVLVTVDAVRANLLQAGFEVEQLGCGRDPAAVVSELARRRPDVVFNLFEGLADRGDTEATMAGLLDWLGLPHTGSPHQALYLAQNKHLTKRLFQGSGLPTPAFLVIEELPVPDCTLGWPVIVKPATQHASVGLDQRSVVTNQAQLNERVTSVLENYGPPVLVEEFIAGRELNVGLIEAPNLRVLAISEILFKIQEPGSWPIVTYDAKWKPGSTDCEATPAQYPAAVAPRLAERLSELAQRAFRLLGCRDYARVDFRVRPSGRPYILEVNPNPDFNPTAGLAAGLACAGLTHAQFTVELVQAALGRGRQASRRKHGGRQ